MKRYLATFTLLLGLAAVARAGTPQDSFYMGQSPLSNTTIQGSTVTTVATANLSVTLAAPTCTNGSASIPGRNCITKFMVQIPTTTIINVLDGGTTVQTIDGLGLGTTGVNTLSLPEDHLGPLCSTAGNSMSINSVVTGGITGNHQVINYEGYTICGGTANKGPMY